jgi:hypothetical protein
MSPPDGAQAVRQIVDRAEEVPLEPPLPLMRELPSADPFPVEALGDVLETAARGIHDRVQAPLAICGQSVLAASVLAVQGHADVLLPIGPGQAKPVSCFLISVAAPGERKSASDSEATWPIRKHEAALQKSYDFDLPDYMNDKIAWDTARETARKSKKGDRAAIKAALDALGPPPSPPLMPMRTCPEPTFEGLCKLLACGQPSLGLFSGEGGQFIGGHGMSEDGKLRTAAGLSSIWDGDDIRRVRVGDGASILRGKRTSMHLLAQPGVADIWFRDHLLAEQGLLSRMLVTAPDSTGGTRFSRAEQPETDRVLKRYGARLLEILETPLPLASGKINELQPRPLALPEGARRLFFKFADTVEIEIRESGQYALIRGLANKLPEHATRLAGILTLIGDIDAGEVAARDMAAGIVLAQHYAAEALRLFGAAQISGDLQLAEKTRQWLLHQWKQPAISLPDLYQRGPNAIAGRARQRRSSPRSKITDG